MKLHQKTSRQYTSASQFKQQGATSMEYLFWSIAAIAVLYAVLTMAGVNFSSSNTQATQREIQGIKLGLQTARGMSGSYAGIYADNLATNKSIPTTLVITGTGATSVATSNSGSSYKVVPGTTTSEIDVTMATDVCGKVLPQLDSTWTTVAGVAPPLTQAQVTTACGTMPVKLVFQ